MKSSVLDLALFVPPLIHALALPITLSIVSYTASNLISPPELPTANYKPWPSREFKYPITGGDIIEIIRATPIPNTSGAYADGVTESMDAITDAEFPMGDRTPVTGRIHAVNGDVTLTLSPLEPGMRLDDGFEMMLAVELLMKKYGPARLFALFLNENETQLAVFEILLRDPGGGSVSET